MANSRTIPATAISELFNESSGDAALVFVTFHSSELNDTIRVVNDPVNFVLDGKEFIGFDFEINLLSDNEEAPRASLAVQNVDSRIGENVLKATNPVNIEIQVIMLSQFNEANFPCTEIVPGQSQRVYRAKALRLVDVEGNIFTVSGSIRSWDYTQENWPGLRGTEDRFPGLYWG